MILLYTCIDVKINIKRHQSPVFLHYIVHSEKNKQQNCTNRKKNPKSVILDVLWADKGFLLMLLSNFEGITVPKS